MTKYFILFVLLLTGCTTTCWTRPDATQQDFLRDRYSCERDMRQSGGYGDGLIGAINASAFFDRCMNAQGYTQTTNCQ